MKRPTGKWRPTARQFNEDDIDVRWKSNGSERK